MMFVTAYGIYSYRLQATYDEKKKHVYNEIENVKRINDILSDLEWCRNAEIAIKESKNGEILHDLIHKVINPEEYSNKIKAGLDVKSSFSKSNSASPTLEGDQSYKL